MSRPNGYLVPGYIDANAVVAEVARGCGVTVDEVMGESRGTREACIARACAMAVIREHLGWSHATIGRFFGRHHTGVIEAVQKVMNDPELSAGVRLVIEELSPPPRLFLVQEEAV